MSKNIYKVFRRVYGRLSPIYEPTSVYSETGWNVAKGNSLFFGYSNPINMREYKHYLYHNGDVRDCCRRNQDFWEVWRIQANGFTVRKLDDNLFLDTLRLPVEHEEVARVWNSLNGENDDPDGVLAIMFKKFKLIERCNYF